MSAPDTNQIIDEQGQAFLEAAEALRSGDRRRAIDLIAGQPTDDLGLLFGRSVTQCIVASTLCGVEVAKLAGHEIGGGDVHFGLDFSGSNDPDEIAAARCITAAANADLDSVGALIQALQMADDPLGSLRRLAGVSVALLENYVSLTGGAS